MADNHDYDTAFVGTVTCSSSDQAVDMLMVRTHVSLIADGDCFVNFDKPVTTNGRYLLKANVPVDFPISFSQLHYLAAASTPKIYVVASRS